VLKPITLKESALKDLGRIIVANLTVDFIDATRVQVTLVEGNSVRRNETLERGDNLALSLEVSLRNKR